jgi:hypothetical protein
VPAIDIDLSRFFFNAHETTSALQVIQRITHERLRCPSTFPSFVSPSLSLALSLLVLRRFGAHVCWKSVGSLLGTSWEPVGNQLGTRWEPVGNQLGTCWEPVENLLGTCWGPVGDLLGTS